MTVITNLRLAGPLMLPCLSVCWLEPTSDIGYLALHRYSPGDGSNEDWKDTATFVYEVLIYRRPTVALFKDGIYTPHTLHTLD